MPHLDPKERKAAEWVRGIITHPCPVSTAFILLEKFSILFNLDLQEVVKTLALKKDQEDNMNKTMGDFK